MNFINISNDNQKEENKSLHIENEVVSSQKKASTNNYITIKSDYNNYNNFSGIPYIRSKFK